MRVALVHDWLTGMRGGERCLLHFLQLYPQADIYTLVHQEGSSHLRIDQRVKATSCLQRLPGVRRYYRLLFPFYPRAARSIKISAYDLVISLSHAAAKNVAISDCGRHICYCFTPMRYIWDQAREYFGYGTALLWPQILRLREWDRSASEGVDLFVAISRFVAARIRRFYGRRCEVIYPPVETNWIIPARDGQRGRAFLYAGAMAPYKRAELAIEACNRLGVDLWVVGAGQQESRLRRLAGKTVKFLGKVSDQQLSQIYRDCRALIFPGTEDFGMVPVECLAAGRPVIARYSGALKESIIGFRSWENDVIASNDYSGVFFPDTGKDEVKALAEALQLFVRYEDRFRPATCVKRAAMFSAERFYSEWSSLAQRYRFDAGLIPDKKGDNAQAEATVI